MAITHPTVTEINALKNAFNAAHVLPDEVFKIMLPKWKARNYKRKEIITAEGDIERRLYFVCEGVQRCFTLHNGKEFTTVFTYPFSLGVVDSFLLQKPSDLTFEALTAGRMLYITYPDFFELAEKFPQLEKWMRITLSQTLSGVLLRNKELSIFTASEKLTALFTRSPHIFNLVPHKYIASYIGVDKTTFSKMLNNIKL